ncbi:MAG: hypothetical protein PHI97_06565 [Desulfobulbus sp.]|nr:hypothetical protein [Desulfobulbus sp.]
MSINGISGSVYNNPMFQTPPQTTGGQTIQQSPQQVQQGPTEENQEGMASQRVENATSSETQERSRINTYA